MLPKREWKPVTLALICSAGTMFVVLVACTASPQWRYEQKLLNTGEPALHAVYSDRLNELMAELNRIMSYPEWDETARTLSHARGAREMADVAGSLAKTAKALPDSAAGLDLSDDEKRLFVCLSEKLHGQAVELQAQAEARQVEKVQGSLDGIMTTCNACHTAFRLK